MSTSTAVTTPVWSNEQLSEVKSFADALALLNEANVTVISTEDLGNGFTVLKDKDQLIKKPFVILDSILNKGENGLFVSLYVVTDDNAKLIINDGSTGIRNQVIRYYEQLNKVALNGDSIGMHLLKGVMVKGGLTRSDYEYTDEKTGDERSASTYYLTN